MNNKNTQKTAGCGAGAKKPDCRPASGKKEGTGDGTVAQSGNGAAENAERIPREGNPQIENVPLAETPETSKQPEMNKPGEPDAIHVNGEPGEKTADELAEPEDGPETSADPAAELADLRRALARAQGELAASRAGVPTEAAEDAVALALAAVEAGTADTVAEALAAVLARHPEWKAAPARAGGFVLGSDPALGGPARQAPAPADPAGKKRWNRFNGMR